jgi:hypothetical protein
MISFCACLKSLLESAYERLQTVVPPLLTKCEHNENNAIAIFFPLQVTVSRSGQKFCSLIPGKLINPQRF